MLARGACVLREMCGERLLAKESVGARGESGERGCWREKREGRERVLAREERGERLYMPGEGCVIGECKLRK